MDFLLFEHGKRYGLSYLVIENDYQTFVFGRTLYYAWFIEGGLKFRDLDGMTCRRLSENAAIELLEKYEHLAGIREFLDRYAALPF